MKERRVRGEEGEERRGRGGGKRKIRKERGREREGGIVGGKRGEKR